LSRLAAASRMDGVHETATLLQLDCVMTEWPGLSCVGIKMTLAGRRLWIMVASGLAFMGVQPLAVGQNSCAYDADYPLGTWSGPSTLDGGPCDTCITTLQQVTPTSGTYSGGSYTNSAISPSAAYSYSSQQPAAPATPVYTSHSTSGEVSANGCEISFNWVDSNNNYGSQTLTYQYPASAPPASTNVPIPPCALAALCVGLVGVALRRTRTTHIQ
jgi:hypothetical protein